MQKHRLMARFSDARMEDTAPPLCGANLTPPSDGSREAQIEARGAGVVNSSRLSHDPASIDLSIACPAKLRLPLLFVRPALFSAWAAGDAKYVCRGFVIAIKQLVNVVSASAISRPLFTALLASSLSSAVQSRSTRPSVSCSTWWRPDRRTATSAFDRNSRDSSLSARNA
jgi:hypothetical protein